jgi:hypothetical protein
MYIYIHSHVYIYLNIYAYIYINTHIYMHIYLCLSLFVYIKFIYIGQRRTNYYTCISTHEYSSSYILTTGGPIRSVYRT